MAANMNNMSAEKKSELEAVFKEFDTNGDGLITLSEAYVVLESCLGLNRDATKRLMKTCDTNRDGCISLDEFPQFYVKVKNKTQEMRAMFAEFDRDHNGFIEMDEAKLALRQMALTDEDIEQIVRSYDTNEDGRLEYDEFVKLWNAS